MGTIYILIASILWGVVHSALASLWFKHQVKKLAGAPAYNRFYRVSYNLFSAASLFPVLMMLVTFPDRQLYSFREPWTFIATLGQGVAAMVLVAGLMQTGPFEFAGLAQLSPYYDEAEPAGLVMNGLYAHVRHPLYSAGLVFIWLSPEMSLNRLAVFSMLSLYTLIGAYFEERKLLREFGADYADYKARTPMLIPYWHRNP